MVVGLHGVPLCPWAVRLGFLVAIEPRAMGAGIALSLGGGGLSATRFRIFAVRLRLFESQPCGYGSLVRPVPPKQSHDFIHGRLLSLSVRARLTAFNYRNVPLSIKL